MNVTTAGLWQEQCSGIVVPRRCALALGYDAVWNQARRKQKHAYLDNATDKLDDVGKLGEVDIEVMQLVLHGLLGDNLAPLAHGAQAPQVTRGIERRVRWLGEVDLGQMRRHGGQRALETSEARG